jgi:DNA-binding CsgD family transcriptional regulator
MAVAAVRKEEPRLLEREEVLGALRDSLAEASKGRGRLVLVVGEAGVGKSAAVRDFCDESRGSARVLWGGCDPLFTPRPLGPFLDIAENAGEELQAAVEQGPPDVVAALLRTAGPRSAAIVVVEDVHWADEATLDVLRLLGRKLGQAPLLVLATYRDDELDRIHPLRVVLGELATHPHVERLPVPPLSPEAVAELAASSAADAVELHRLTGGNPFFVTEVLASGNGTIPSSVRDAVLARAARLTESARALLDAVAIAPPRVELWLLEALAGKDVSALEECLSSGMLVARAGAVEFRHELARLAIEESLEPRRRLSLHREALAALTAPQAGAPDVARLAYHADAAEDADAVLRFAPAAATRAASLGAHREAAVHYGRALRFGDRLDPGARAGLLEQRSRACYLADEIGEAIESIEDALELRRALGQKLEEGNSLCWLSDILWCPGRTAESEQAARRALELLETLPPSRELAWAYTKQGSVALAARGVELAREFGETELEVRALGSLGMLTFSDGGKEKLEQALALAREAGLVEPTGRALVNIVGEAIAATQYALAAEYLDEAIGYCSEHGLELYRYYALAYRARFELDLGRWDDAAETASTVLRIPRASILPRIWGLVVLALVRGRRGDPGHRELLEEAWSLAEPTEEVPRRRPVAVARAEIAWLHGDRAGVAAATDRLLQQAVEREDPSAVGELTSWRRRAGIDDGPLPFTVPEPYAAQLSGDWARAARIWSELGRSYETALALAETDDEESLRRALDDLQTLGAKPTAAIVARHLQQQGFRNVPRGPRPSTRRNEAQLTARELEVLRQLAEGRRNAAIAERLFVSPRTIDHHVSAILRKLDVQSRGEAVAEAARLGLLEDPHAVDAI